MNKTIHMLFIALACSTIMITADPFHSVDVPTQLVRIYNDSGKPVSIHTFPAHTSQNDPRVRVQLPAKTPTKNTIMVNATVAEGVPLSTRFIVNGTPQDVLINTWQNPKLVVQKDLSIKVNYLKKKRG